MKKLLLFTMLISILIQGCGSPNLPKENEIDKWNAITLDNMIEELGMKKIKDNLYAGKLDEKGLQYMGNYCSMKGGSYKLLEHGYDFSYEILKTGDYIKGAYSFPLTKACIKDNNYLFLFIEQEYQVYDRSSNSKYYGKYYFISSDKNNTKNYENFVDNAKKREIKAQKEIEERTREREKKKEAENLAKVEKNKMLKARKGQHVVTFFDSDIYDGVLVSKDMCENLCSTKNLEDSGYSSLNEALKDGWKFVSKLGDATHNFSTSCICKGSNVIMQK